MNINKHLHPMFWAYVTIFTGAFSSVILAYLCFGLPWG